jgi:hypothetical protein
MTNHRYLAAAILLATISSLVYPQEIDPRLLWSFETGG